MLKITIPGREWFNEDTQEFSYTSDTTIMLEHSLISLSKWESKWKKPFLDSKVPRTTEESIDYIRCMTITQNVDPKVYLGLTPEIIKEVNDYIDDPMTATWFHDDEDSRGSNREKITNELIYYWMASLGIPVEFEKWHLNRLITLIKVFNVKNAPPKKMSPEQIAARNAKLNAERRKAWKSKG